MRLDHWKLLVALSVLVPVGRAEAQRCMGVASFASGTGRVALGALLTDGAKSYGMTLGMGQDKGLFGSGAVSRTTFDNASFVLTGLAGSIGYQVALGDGVELCPYAGVVYSSGSQGFGASYVDVSRTDVGFGGSLGFVASSSPTFDFVPAAGFEYLTTSSSSTVTPFGDRGTLTASGKSSNYSVVSLSAGFIFNKSVTLQPIVEIPVGLDQAKVSYGIGIGLNFGSRKK